MTDRSERAVATRECPLCGSRKGEPCLYLDVKQPPRAWDGSETGRAWDRYRLNGTPTERAHNERMRQLRDRPRFNRPQPMPPPNPTWSPTYWANLEALRRADLAEYQQLHEWLRVWGHILWTR